MNAFSSFFQFPRLTKILSKHQNEFAEQNKPTVAVTNMIASRTFHIFLLLVGLSTQSVSAFNPSKPPSSGKEVFDTLKASTIDFNDEWTSLTKTIASKIGSAEDKEGKPLSEEAKDDIIATAVAGSVLGTAIGSPLLIGAAIGYAGTQMLSEEQRGQAQKVLGKASKDLIQQAQAAVAFTKEQLEQEEDLSAASKKILLAIQEKANQVQEELKTSPQTMMDKMKTNVMKTVESDEFKSLPKNAFHAVRAFIESDEVKKASSSAMKAIKDGLESEEMKALQSRATKAVKETIEPGKKNP